MANKEQKIRSEVADKVFYDLPTDKERRKMSAKELAKLLSECEKDTPKFFLIQHELNIRIVKEQSKPVYFGILMAIIGIILGWLLSQRQPFNNPTSLDIIAEHISSKMASENMIGSQNKNQESVMAKPYNLENGIVKKTTEDLKNVIETTAEQNKLNSQEAQNIKNR